MTTALLLLIGVGMFFTVRILARQNREIIELLQKIDKKPVEKPVYSPNKLAKQNPDIVQFDENNPLAIPENVKFELEGGDMLTPFDTGKN